MPEPVSVPTGRGCDPAPVRSLPESAVSQVLVALIPPLPVVPQDQVLLIPLKPIPPVPPLLKPAVTETSPVAVVGAWRAAVGIPTLKVLAIRATAAIRIVIVQAPLPAVPQDQVLLTLTALIPAPPTALPLAVTMSADVRI